MYYQVTWKVRLCPLPTAHKWGVFCALWRCDLAHLQVGPLSALMDLGAYALRSGESA